MKIEFELCKYEMNEKGQFELCKYKMNEKGQICFDVWHN